MSGFFEKLPFFDRNHRTYSFTGLLSINPRRFRKKHFWLTFKWKVSMGRVLIADMDSSKPLNLPYHVRNLYERYLLTLEVVGCKQLDVNTWYVLSTIHNWEHGTFKITRRKKQIFHFFNLKPGDFWKNKGGFHKQTENGRCWSANICWLNRNGRWL